MPVDLLLCAATELELDRLRPAFEGKAPSLAVLRTGVGPVNAAHAVTVFLERTGARNIIICGVGGAYPGSGLAVGDVVCASSEYYGDLGATTPSGFLDMRALGFPVIESPDNLYNELPLQLFPVDRRVRFVTVTSCTGSAIAARAIEARTGGAVESMEGAAIVHVAHLHGVPVGQVRGISNLVTDREPSAWRLHEAAAAAQDAVVSWVECR